MTSTTSFKTNIAIYNKYFAPLSHPLDDAVRRFLLSSQYACRQQGILHKLLQEDTCLVSWWRKEYRQHLRAIAMDLPVSAVMKELRQFRHRVLMRLVIREYAKLATAEDSLASWSDFADEMLLFVLEYCETALKPRYGVPRDSEGELVTLYTVTMGKLGGQELNYSSDIDLIFAFSANGETDGRESITNQQYFSKLIQQVTQMLHTNTPEGFVFRVDLRLRPNGDSGPLVIPLSAMETYYQEQGRDWERYAMVKARALGDGSTTRLDKLIKPFVYRRYVDFSAIESLRGMKALIAREVMRNPMQDDIKRGQGGIREIEFIIQCFQLIRGGRLPALQQKNALQALAAIEESGVLIAPVSALKSAYLFLRKLENAIQVHHDQQTHQLPHDEAARQQVALAMAYPSWEKLIETLNRHRQVVSDVFQGVLGHRDAYEDEKRLLATQLANVWQGHVEETMAANFLASLGYAEPLRCFQMIQAFRHSPRCGRLSQAARLRLDRFMVLLLSELAETPKTDEVLLQALRLLEAIVGRSAYLALLTENRTVLQELLHWFLHSPYITSLLVEQPFLLEVLVDQDIHWRLERRPQLRHRLQERLSQCTESGEKEESLRQFKLTCWLLAARAELYGQAKAVRIGRFLADVTHVIIECVVTLAADTLQARYPDINTVISHFAIVAYGKLGSAEMNYDSDVDLVFLHQVAAGQESLVTRLTQKILHLLTLRTQSGVLYQVDTRLRPSGSSGLLVSHIAAYLEYQQHHAWVWEHQALIRARVIVGSRSLRRQVLWLKEQVLCRAREPAVLLQEVHDMREKISKHAGQEAIKLIPGGLLDSEFLVQYLVLQYPSLALVRLNNTLALVAALHHQGVLTERYYKRLASALGYYHTVLHRQILKPLDSLNTRHPKAILAMLRRLMPKTTGE